MPHATFAYPSCRPLVIIPQIFELWFLFQLYPIHRNLTFQSLPNTIILLFFALTFRPILLHTNKMFHHHLQILLRLVIQNQVICFPVTIVSPPLFPITPMTWSLPTAFPFLSAPICISTSALLWISYLSEYHQCQTGTACYSWVSTLNRSSEQSFQILLNSSSPNNSLSLPFCLLLILLL